MSLSLYMAAPGRYPKLWRRRRRAEQCNEPNHQTHLDCAAYRYSRSVYRSARCAAGRNTVAGQAASPGGEAIPGPTLADVEAALAAIDADTGIEDAVKDLLRPKYKQAIDALKEAADFAVKERTYREVIKTGSHKAADLRGRVEGPPVG